MRHALAEILTSNNIRDPDLSGVSVTVSEVRVSPDMKNAAVFCTPLGGVNADTIVEALNRHQPMLRGELAHAVTLKHTPELSFIYDDSFDRADSINDLINSTGITDIPRDRES